MEETQGQSQRLGLKPANTQPKAEMSPLIYRPMTEKNKCLFVQAIGFQGGLLCSVMASKAARPILTATAQKRNFEDIINRRED